MQATAVRTAPPPAKATHVHSNPDGSAGSSTIADTPEWKALAAHAEEVAGLHLRELLQSEERSIMLSMESDGVYADFSRQRVTGETISV